MDGVQTVTTLSVGKFELRFFDYSDDFVRKGRKRGTDVS